MPKFNFDGPNKRIIMTNEACINGVSTFNLIELWSEWCDWVVLEDNIKYPPALEVLMVPLTATDYVGPYLFIRNDLGWMGVPPNVNPCTVIIEGSFFGTDPNSPVMVNHTEQTTDLIINRSVLTTSIVTSSTSSSGLTTEEHDKLMSIPSSASSIEISGLTIEQNAKLMSLPSSTLETDERSKLLGLNNVDITSLVDAVWDKQLPGTSISVAEYVVQKLLTTNKFIGLQ